MKSKEQKYQEAVARNIDAALRECRHLRKLGLRSEAVDTLDVASSVGIRKSDSDMTRKYYLELSEIAYGAKGG